MKQGTAASAEPRNLGEEFAGGPGDMAGGNPGRLHELGRGAGAGQAPDLTSATIWP
jgi:hypothetical protein